MGGREASSCVATQVAHPLDPTGPCRLRRTHSSGTPAEQLGFERDLLYWLFPIEGVGPDFAVVGASVRG